MAMALTLTITNRSLVPALVAALAAGAAGGAPGCATTSQSDSDPADGAAQMEALAAVPPETVREATSTDEGMASAAVAALRARGQSGLDQLLAAHAEEVERLRRHPRAMREPAMRRLSAAIDSVAGQRDAYASGLFWYTDLSAAKHEAERSGKLILSLRLLGRLDEDLSCANSRLFRALLYPNAVVADAIRRGYVLHWSSERPAPRIEIDFGDGRRIQRTITGNSIHYVLDARGRVLDALPGLYAASAFVRELERTRAQAGRCGGDVECWRAYHRDRIRELDVEWQSQLLRAARTGVMPELPPGARSEPPAQAGAQANALANDASPSALAAAPIAVGKAAIEVPILRLMRRTPGPLVTRPDDVYWRRVAELYLPVLGPIDARSRAVIAAKLGRRGGAARLSRVVERLELLVAEDTVRNEQQRRRRIHEWLAAGGDERQTGFDALNARVYRELFLTPRSDPWLGLLADDLFTGIEDEQP